MLYSDNEYKWVVVLNRKVPMPQLFNAVGHLAVGMRAGCQDEAARRFHDYEASDGKRLSTVSHWPVIVLQADNSNQLRTLRASAIDSGVPCQAFVDAMVGRSAEEQMLKSKTADESGLEYFAIFLFGKAEDLRVLVKKFSLFTPPHADAYPRPFHTLDPH